MKPSCAMSSMQWIVDFRENFFFFFSNSCSWPIRVSLTKSCRLFAYSEISFLIFNCYLYHYYFTQFNNSNTGLFNIDTGKDDIRKVHKVHSWNGLTQVWRYLCGLNSMYILLDFYWLWSFLLFLFFFANELKSWPTGRLPSATWSMAQLARCGLPSWRRRALYPSTAPMPAGESLKSAERTW